MYNTLITKEEVIDILKWAEEQGHIKGDIDLVIQNVLAGNTTK